MIRFTAPGAQGQVLGMGLSHGNLDLLAQGRPIRFDLAPYGDTGHLLILTGSEADVAAAIATGDHVLGLTPRTLDSLRNGNVIPVELAALGITAIWQALLFAGPTERKIVDDMRGAGLIAADAKLDWDEYERHERNEVAGCADCASRPPPARFPWRQLPWRRWAIPLAVLIVVAVVLGILLAPVTH
jgi:hypothetical protein